MPDSSFVLGCNNKSDPENGIASHKKNTLFSDHHPEWVKRRKKSDILSKLEKQLFSHDIRLTLAERPEKTALENTVNKKLNFTRFDGRLLFMFIPTVEWPVVLRYTQP